MKRTLILAAAAMMAMGSVGCTSRPLRSVFNRGAACGSTLTTPFVGDMTTTYSPGCNQCGGADCPACGTTSGMPMMVDPGYFGGYLEGSPLPNPVEPQQ